MGEVKEQERTLRTSKKTNSKTAVSPRHAGRKPRGKIQKKPTPAKLRKRGAAGAFLRSSINEQVGLQSDQIAKAVVNKTLAGDMTGARILIQITGADKVPVEVKKKSGPSWAMQLAAEPLWQGAPDPGEDVGFGGREPEY